MVVETINNTKKQIKLRFMFLVLYSPVPVGFVPHFKYNFSAFHDLIVVDERFVQGLAVQCSRLDIFISAHC